jgi:hypothetical protein
LLPYKYYNTNYEAELINCFAVGKIIAPGIYDYDLEKKANEIFQLFFPGTSMTLASYSAAIGHGIGYIDPSEYK